MLVVFFQTVFAQSESDPYMWAPKNMVTGEFYEGVIVLADAPSSGQIIVLSSSNPAVIEIPQSTTVLPYSNHGIFSIKPLHPGEAQIFAVVDGKIITTQVIVYSSSRQAEDLKIILPTNLTKTDTMIGYVISVDARGSPAPVLVDTPVWLSSTPLIDFESSNLELKTGKHYAKFIAKIKGSGKIYAGSERLGIAEHEVTKIQDLVSVKVAVAPNIIMENSQAYFFVWLEKDGKPFKPPYMINAFVSSSNLNSIRFNENPAIKHQFDSIMRVSLVDGVGVGRLISQNSGNSVITASVEGFGSAQANAIVGPVLLDENFAFVEPDHDDKLGQIEFRTPNMAFAWFYPQVTDSKAFGVIAFYHMNFTKNTTTIVTANDTQIFISNTIKRVVPVPIDGRTVSISSVEGLKHPSVLVTSKSNEVLLTRGIGSTHAAKFEVTGTSQGNYTISISGAGMETFHSTLIIAPPYSDSYSLKMTSIPFTSGMKSDLAMISVVDDSGALINSQKMFAEPLRVIVSLDNKRTELSISSLNSAVYSDVVDKKTNVIVSANGFTPIKERIEPSDIASSIVLDVPKEIHVLESFPYAIHETDNHGTPIRKLNSTNIASTPEVLSDGKYLHINSVGTKNLAAISNVGADSKQIDSFANVFGFSIITNGVTNRIEKEFELRLDSDVEGFEVLLDSPIPYKKINTDTYLITPDKEGHHNLTFTAIKSGYIPATKSFSIFVEKFVNLTLSAIASDGAELNMGLPIKIGNTTKIVVTPYQAEVRPQFFEMGFPEDFVTVNKGYKLDHVVIGEQKIGNGKITNLFLDENADIRANYQRMVKIEVENAEGSGFYPYGHTVVLYAPPRDKVSFLVRDVFDHWDGLDYTSDRVTLVATQDVTARAVLREDYTFLMLIITGIALLFFYNNFIKRKGVSLAFYFEQLNLLRVVKIIKSRLQVKTKHKRY